MKLFFEIIFLGNNIFEISLQPQPPHQEMLRLFTGSLFYKLHCKMGFYAAQVEKNHLISRNRKFQTNCWLKQMRAFDTKQVLLWEEVRKSWFAISTKHNTENSQKFSHEFPFMCHHPPWFSQDIAINDDVGAQRCFHWHHRPDVFQPLGPPISPRPLFSWLQRLHHSSPWQSGCELIWLSEIKRKCWLRF